MVGTAREPLTTKRPLMAVMRRRNLTMVTIRNPIIKKTNTIIEYAVMTDGVVVIYKYSIPLNNSMQI